MEKTDVFHVLDAGDSLKLMFDSYGVRLEVNLVGVIHLAEELEDQVLWERNAPFAHHSFDYAENEAYKSLAEQKDSNGFFCMIFKNMKAYAIVTHDGVKTFEVI